MRMKTIFVLILCCCVSFFSYASWQQHTATTIVVTLDDREHFLHGFEKIIYTNNSPDTLNSIYIHLWPNAYKNDRTKFCEQQVQQGKTAFYFSPEKDKGYIDSIAFSIDGYRVDFDYVTGNTDIAIIQLPKPLLPKASLNLETPFRVKIPEIVSRLGHNGQAYFISQWFPKPAVYDLKGWHPMPYLDQGEFYSEIGGYDVSITLPENYIVMATGNCLTESEVARMDSLGKLALPSDTLFKNTFPESSRNYKTIRFTENNIHDFAWFADKRWIVRQDTVSGQGNEGITKVQTAFLPMHQKEWEEGNNILKATIRSYGSTVGKYPYQTIKALEGDMGAGGGMEYPTVTIIDQKVVSELSTVLVHEAGHNWFYGMLANNERDYPWMDEGINSFYEHKTTQLLKENRESVIAQKLDDAFYYYLVSANQDQPSAIASARYNPVNYGADVYNKTARLMEWLEDYIGRADFEKGMKVYFETWKFKHPYPGDFRKIMQANTSKNLDWFFEGALNTDKKIEFKLKKVAAAGSDLRITVKNKSEFAAPISVAAYYKDTMQVSFWIAPFKGDKVITFPDLNKWDKLKLNATFADFKLSDNVYYRYRLFHKGGIQLKPFFGLGRSEKNKIFIAPALGSNNYNGFSLGILLHNLSFPKNRFQFAIAPLYSFGSKDINGVGAFSYSWFPRNTFKEIRFQTNIKSFAERKSTLNITNPVFAHYFKVAPSVSFTFKERSAMSKVERKLLLRQYNIGEEYFTYTQNPVDSLYRPSVASAQHTYALLRYEHKNNRTFHPFDYNIEAQFGQNFIKLGLETKLRIDYDVPNKSFYLRAYAGKFISTNANTDNSRYYLNTTFSGVNDYLLDGTYYGRNENEGAAAQQISIQEGGFKIPTNLYANPLGRSDDWLLALNLKTDLPLGKLPVRLYADIATFANAKRLDPAGDAVSFSAGIEVYLLKGVCSFYLPLVMSKSYSNYIKELYGDKKFLRSITFALNLRNFNFLRSQEELFKLVTTQ